MYIVERRRITKSFPYLWDRTFYVCESKRENGKPNRIVVAMFKNACSLDEAVTNQQAEINRFREAMPKSAAFGVSKSALIANMELLQRELAVLIACRSKLPDWRTDPLGEVPYELWPKRKERKPSCRMKAVTVRVPESEVETVKRFAAKLRDTADHRA